MNNLSGRLQKSDLSAGRSCITVTAQIGDLPQQFPVVVVDIQIRLRPRQDVPQEDQGLTTRF